MSEISQAVPEDSPRDPDQLVKAHLLASLEHFDRMSEAYADPVISNGAGKGLMSDDDWNSIMDTTRENWNENVRTIVQGQIDRGEVKPEEHKLVLTDEGKLPADFGVSTAFKSGVLDEQALQAVRTWSQAEATNQWAAERASRPDAQNTEALAALAKLCYHAGLVTAHQDAANAELSGDQDARTRARSSLEQIELLQRQVQQPPTLQPQGE